MEQVLLSQMVVATEIAMVVGEDDEGVFELPVVFQGLNHTPDVVVELFDEAHVNRTNLAHDLVPRKSL